MNVEPNPPASSGTSTNPTITRIEDGATTQLATVAQQHLGDGLVQPAAGGAVLTSGPSQITDLIGTASRLREAGADQQPVLGVQSGIASLEQEFLTTCTTTVTAGTGGVVAPSVAASTGLTLTVTTTASMKVGAKLNFEPGTTNYESAYIKAIPSGTTVTVVFGSGGALFTHTANYTVQWFLANQERDFSGEGPMATGIGAAMAAEFESNSGGPPLSTLLASGLTLDADRNWQGKAFAQLAITATGAGNTSLVFSGNPWTSGLIVGQAILLSVGVNGATVEEVTVSKNNTPVTGAGPITVNLVNPVVNASSTFATFDIFGLDGPGNGNATPIGIEDSAIYVRDPAPTDPKRPFVAWKGTAGVGQVAALSPGTPITASSGNVANGAAVATLVGVAGKTTYITGFQITAAGATAALVVTVTVVGTVTGTMSYTFTFPAGAAVGATPLAITFPAPVPASAVNTAIVVTLPAGGAGNTNATVSAQGFQL